MEAFYGKTERTKLKGFECPLTMQYNTIDVHKKFVSNVEKEAQDKINLLEQ